MASPAIDLRPTFQKSIHCESTKGTFMLTSAPMFTPHDAAKNWQLSLRGVALMAALSLVLWTGALAVDLPSAQFLALHTTLEVISIIVAMLGFGIAWNAYSQERPGNIVTLGAILFGTGLLDFGHTLSYAGMPELLTPSSAQKAISFWLPARMLMALGLLAISLQPWQPLRAARTRYWLMAAVLVYVALVYWVILLRPEQVPALFVDGKGLTGFKVNVEYVLVAAYALAAVLFLLKGRRTPQSNAADLFAAAAIAALSELFFTRYERVTDLVNAMGHVYKIASYYFIFRAVFMHSVRQPFEALRRALDHEKIHAAEQHSFVRTLDLLEEAVLEVDRAGIIRMANAGWWQLAGMSPRADLKLLEYLHQDDRNTFELQFFGLVLGNKDEFHGRYRFAKPGQEERWLECRFVAERGDDGQTIGARGVLRDITKTYVQERRITHMALHDALTGLPNRVLLEDRIRQSIQQAARSGNRVAVCFIDLDHFKNINDAYGHKSGDVMLQATAQLLKSCLRDGDTLARWGGDEFVVLLPNLTVAGGARQVAQKMVEAMRQNIVLDKLTVSATFSMGIAVYPDDEGAGDLETLLSQADRAMFHAKSQGRNNYQLFSEMSTQGRGKKELLIQTRLAHAIREGRIEAWFQPQVAAQAAADGNPKLVGVEALARWHDPELGWIAPSIFVPMAEHLGLIAELGSLMRRKSLAQFVAWRALHPALTLSINISKRELFAADLVPMIQSDLAFHGLDPRAVVLEITESAAMVDVTFAQLRLRQLVDVGYTLAIDDFGTGYSSLSQLHELPIGELKIDISFVRRIHSAEGLRMAQGIIGLAKALNLRTVAEGVEDEATAQVLREIGSDVLQGYHYARPCPAGDLVAMPLFAKQASLVH